ncbi:unnamed protein product [Paramecium pentaurelia]|uniref:Uncharacterized protein n=1 Tax=Paramecium pentaurelia TaxID=43138 RepID=A0A8S1X6D9_9CILI|nr:unnamed protein product [Paramecium pentaurelia]
MNNHLKTVLQKIKKQRMDLSNQIQIAIKGNFKDSFPIRGQLQNSQVKNESNLSSLYSQSFEQESLTASKKVVQEPKQPLPLAVKPILNKEKVMILVWVNLPSIYNEQSKEFWSKKQRGREGSYVDKSPFRYVSQKLKFWNMIFDFSSYYQMKLKKIEIKRCIKILQNKFLINGKVQERKEKQIITKFQQIIKKNQEKLQDILFQLSLNQQFKNKCMIRMCSKLCNLQKNNYLINFKNNKMKYIFKFLIRVLNQISQMQQIMLSLLSLRQKKIENQQMLLVLPIVKEDDLQMSVQQIKNRLMFVSMRKWIK